MTKLTFPALRSSALAGAAALALAGCSLAPTYERPAAPVPQTIQGAASANAAAIDQTPAADVGWQNYYADPRLKALIGIALENNRDLRVAAMNIEAARAQYGLQRADLLPGVGAGAEMNRSRTSADVSPTGAAVTGSVYGGMLTIPSYELDFFGRVRNLTSSALSNYLGTREARDSAHIALVAEVARAYVAQQAASEQMRISSLALKSREKTYELAQLRFRAGVTSAIDLRQNETLIEAAKADYALQTRLREQAGNALALLIGQPIPANLPKALPLGQQVARNALPVGLSSEVLLRRPDIRQSEYQLLAANANIGAARAAFFPRITLTGNIGGVSREVDNLFDGPNRAWSFLPQIYLPIFDWGRNQSNLDLAEARKHISVSQYEKSIQNAFREVADGLVARSTLADQLASQQRSYRAESERLRLVTMRYENGISSSLDLLDAQRQSYAQQQQLVNVQQQVMNNRIDLYKVLGGGLLEQTGVPSTTATGGSVPVAAPAGSSAN